jgi:alpha-mannosidase
VEVQPHAGAWPKTRSFASVEQKNVIVTALKKAEDSDDLVFRFYEFEGKSTAVKMNLPEAATSAVETDLMEKQQHPIALQGHELTIPTGPYEIKTVAVSFPSTKN